MQPYISWYLLLPAALSVLYGYTQFRYVTIMGTAKRWRAWLVLLTTALSGGVLTVAWSATGFPLPILYVAAYLFRAERLIGRDTFPKKGWFLLNLGFINTMALHMVLIGMESLMRGATMHTLLDDGFWRTMSVAAVLAADSIECLLFLRQKKLPAALAAESESEEARSFMAFLWFCTGYLLVDSFLCVTELEPLYPPLFLIGSIVVLMYFIVRFLFHIHALIRAEYLKVEHDRLAARLEIVQGNAGALKRIVDRDVLTGAFSRRHIMKQIQQMMQAAAPFSLVFLDLDGLKRLNDSEGHDAGDRHLIGFAEAMKARLPADDLLARVGGDEFVILMPGCDAETASRRMADIRVALGANSGGAFRFSYGVTAAGPGEARNAETLLQDADRAMYHDKERRR